MAQPILVEGYTPEEILSLDAEQVEVFICAGGPLILRIGTAEVLGELRVVGARLTVELAQIDGGGEGVLPMLWLLVERYARQRGLAQVAWVVHALTCASPNLKLRRVLARRGFVVCEVANIGAAFYYLQEL